MNKQFHIQVENKELLLEMGNAALKKIKNSSHPVYIGLELYFSCLVKKIIVALDKKPDRQVFEILPNLFIYFRPVQSKACNIHELIGTNSPTLIDFPVVKRRALIPDYVYLNYKKSNWTGDFTWSRKSRKQN